MLCRVVRLPRDTIMDEHAHHQHHGDGAVQPRAQTAGHCCTTHCKDEPVPPVAPLTQGMIYTCPMHPEVRQDHPGNCPKCGMTLEPVMPTLEDDENPELADFRRRFWWT